MVTGNILSPGGVFLLEDAQPCNRSPKVHYESLLSAPGSARFYLKNIVFHKSKGRYYNHYDYLLVCNVSSRNLSHSQDHNPTTQTTTTRHHLICLFLELQRSENEDSDHCECIHVCVCI